MAKKLGLLVDTDIFIEYFNHQLFRELFESPVYQVYYSVVTQKELLAKEGLKQSERKEIQRFLKRFRMVPLERQGMNKYSDLRKEHPAASKEDSLIAATAITKRLLLVTRNYRHYRIFPELKLYFR